MERGAQGLPSALSFWLHTGARETRGAIANFYFAISGRAAQLGVEADRPPLDRNVRKTKRRRRAPSSPESGVSRKRNGDSAAAAAPARAMLTEQTKELTAIGQKVAVESVGPLARSVSETFTKAS